MSNARITMVKKSALFAGLDAKTTEKMLSDPSVSTETYSQGAYLMRKDDPVHRLGILTRGQAVAERRSKDGMMHMSRLDPPDLFGAASLFNDQGVFVLDIRCVTDCEAILIPEETLMRWFGESQSVLRNYLRYLSKRIRFLNHRLDALSKNTVPAKLMSHFLSVECRGVIRVKSYTELAESLCLSRATLYRALDSLCKENKIRREGKRIYLLEEDS